MVPGSRRARIVLSAFLIFLVYGVVIEPRRLTVTTIDIHEGRLAHVLAGRRAVVIGDLHFGADGEPAATAALRRLDELRPDLILLVGDYVKWGSRAPAYDQAFAFLAQLQAPLGVFAVLGDADQTFSRKSCEFCHEAGSGASSKQHHVVFLSNERRAITTPRGDLSIIGVDSERDAHGATRVRQLLAGGEPALLLSHTSAIYNDISSTREVLTLSGDTHGGQVWLPAWFWRLTRLKPDPAHVYGYFQDGSKALVVTRGLGTSRVHFRLGAPPEIVVLEFKE